MFHQDRLYLILERRTRILSLTLNLDIHRQAVQDQIKIVAASFLHIALPIGIGVPKMYHLHIPVQADSSVFLPVFKHVAKKQVTSRLPTPIHNAGSPQRPPSTHQIRQNPYKLRHFGLFIPCFNNMRCRPWRAKRRPVVPGRRRRERNAGRAQGPQVPEPWRRYAERMRHAVEPFVVGMAPSYYPRRVLVVTEP